MPPTGGIRERLIRDNLWRLVNTTLDQMGWFEESSDRMPVTFAPHPLDFTQEVKPNVVSLAEEHQSESELELGSSAAEVTAIYYVDVLAEDTSVGLHLAGDIRASLAGRLPVLGRTEPVLYVYDIREATPSLLFHCDLQHFLLEKVTLAEGFQARRPFQRYLYTIRVVVVDEQDGLT